MATLGISLTPRSIRSLSGFRLTIGIFHFVTETNNGT